jgi:hypothetical protein
MKRVLKISIVFVMTIFMLKSYCQSWNGIPISGTFASLKTNMLSKGFRLIKKEGSSAYFEGSINGVNYEVVSYCTPISNQVANLSIYLPIKETWSAIKSEYKYIKELIIEKYGEPEQYEYFSSPYYEGDGYEMSAVVGEKCVFSAFWLNIRNEPNLSIMTEISKYKQVQINYQNNENIKKATQEKDALNKKVF